MKLFNLLLSGALLLLVAACGGGGGGANQGGGGANQQDTPSCEAGQTLNDARNACRDLTNADCQAGQTLNDARTGCIALVENPAPPDTPPGEDAPSIVHDTVYDSQMEEVQSDFGFVITPSFVARDKEEAKQILERIAGRDLTDEEVDTILAILNKAPVEDDCASEGQVLDGGTCSGCFGETPILYGNECGPSADMCLARNQILRGAACGAPSNAECIARAQLLNSSGTACRPLTNADCEAGQTLNDAGVSCRALVVDDCTANDQILSGGSCLSCEGQTPARVGNVCGPTAEICTAQNQILRGAVCESPTDAECRANEQRLNTATNICRALIAGDCLAGEVFDGGVCRALLVADCTANNQILSGNSCVACSGETPARYGNECGPTADMCLERKQVLRNAACGAPSDAECVARKQLLNDARNACRLFTNEDCIAQGELLNAGEDGCRPLVAEDCASDDQILSNGSCVSCGGETPVRYGNVCGPSAEACIAQNQILRGAVCGAPTVDECIARGLTLTVNTCRPLTNTDCQTGQILRDGSCITQTDADCRANNKRLDNVGACRALTNTDCQEEGKTLRNGSCDTPTDAECRANNQRLAVDVCRALTNADCQADGQVLRNDSCGAPTADECAARNQRLATTTNTCRALTNADCEAAGEKLNDAGTGCRALVAADCTADDKILSGSSCSSCAGQTPVRYGNECGPSAEICIASNQILRGAVCGSPTVEECTARRQQLNDAGNACRPIINADCEAGETLNDAGNACRTLVAEDCTAEDKILSGGSCLSCSGQTPVRYENVCGPTAEACVAQNQILRGTACGSPTNAECTARNQHLNDAGDACRTLVAEDCTAEDKILSGDSCLSCSGQTPARYGNVCGPTADACVAQNQILRGATCGAPTDTECRARGQRLNDARDACQDSPTAGTLTDKECRTRAGYRLNFAGDACIYVEDTWANLVRQPDNSEVKRPQLSTAECRAYKRSYRLKDNGTGCFRIDYTSCQNLGLIYARKNGNKGAWTCRRPTKEECLGNYRRLNRSIDSCNNLSNEVLPPPTDAECRADNNQRLNNAEVACRPLSDRDCRAEGKVLDTETGNSCRSLVQADCLSPYQKEHTNFTKRLNAAGDACVCDANGSHPIDIGLQCRALYAQDCGIGTRTETPVYAGNGRCRAERSADCDVSYQTWNGSSCESTKSPTEELARSQKALDGINAGYAHERGYLGQGVTVGIVDSAWFHNKYSDLDILKNHEDLAQNYVTLSLPSPYSTRRKSGRWTSPSDAREDHALRVAGIIAAAKNSVGIVGVAPEAKWGFIFFTGGYQPFHKGGGGSNELFSIMIDNQIPIVNGSYEFYNNLGHHGHGFTASFIDVNTGIELDVPLGYTPFWEETYTPSSIYRYRTDEGGDLASFAEKWDSNKLKEYMIQDANVVKDSDTIFVWAAGNDGWHRGNGVENISYLYEDFDVENDPGIIARIRDEKWGSFADLPESIPNGTPMLPILSPDLRDNWLAVVAFDEERAKRGLLAWYSNGCGGAKMWCLAAPTEVTTSGVNWEGNKDIYRELEGTSGAAPHVSGALALLKSAAPLLPMTVIHGIILTTATDYGDPGVDDVFGWGLVNVSAGITLIEGIKTAAPDGAAAGAGVNLRDLQFTLPERFSYLRERLGESAAVALEITDGTYYNLPLSKIAGISTSGDDNKQQADASLADLEMSFVEYAAKTHSALPFFTRDGGGGGVLLQKREEGLHPFLAFDGGNNLAESAYQQVGFRWQKTRARFGVVAEASHIRESEAFWGVDFGALGDMSAQTEQAKLLLSGELSEEYGWSGYAGYEHARARGLLSNNNNNSTGNFIAGIEGAAASGWLAGLEKVNIFHRDDRLRLSARQETRISGGGLLLEMPQATGDFTSAIQDGKKQEVKLRSALIPLREESSIIWGLGYVSGIGSSEWAAAVEHDQQGKTSISAKWGYAF